MATFGWSVFVIYFEECQTCVNVYCKDEKNLPNIIPIVSQNNRHYAILSSLQKHILTFQNMPSKVAYGRSLTFVETVTKRGEIVEQIRFI